MYRDTNGNTYVVNTDGSVITHRKDGAVFLSVLTATDIAYMRTVKLVRDV